jgi:hypothetical protein
MRLLPSIHLTRRIVAGLWALAYIWLLIRTLLLRNASPQVFGEAEEAEILLCLNLSAPISLLIVLVSRWVSLAWWIYPENDARTILAVWLFFFVIGCLQWFVLFPWMIHKGFDLYDYVACLVRRK